MRARPSIAAVGSDVGAWIETAVVETTHEPGQPSEEPGLSHGLPLRRWADVEIFEGIEDLATFGMRLSDRRIFDIVVVDTRPASAIDVSEAIAVISEDARFVHAHVLAVGREDGADVIAVAPRPWQDDLVPDPLHLDVGSFRRLSTEIASRPLVLVVDDDADVRMIALIWLSKVGYRVSQAVDGAQGLDLAWRIRPDVIVTGILMPVMGGFSLLELLAASDVTASMPAIVWTAGAVSDEHVARGYELGCVDYISKGGGKEALVSAVSKQIRR